MGRGAVNGQHLRNGTPWDVPCPHTWYSASVPDTSCHDEWGVGGPADHTQPVQPCQQHAQPDARPNDPHFCPDVNSKYGSAAAASPTTAATAAPPATTDARLRRIHNPAQVVLGINLV